MCIRDRDINEAKKKALRNNQIFKNATTEMVELSLGEPNRIRQMEEFQEWVYLKDEKIFILVSFKDDKVASGKKY